MKPAEIIYQLRELQTTWRQQSFFLNEGQRVTYDRLLQLRRERVQELRKSGRVFKGSKGTEQS